MAGLLLGYDVGSSSIKATLMEAETGKVLASATSPQEKELKMIANKPGWAEQYAETWWKHLKLATQQVKNQTDYNLKKEDTPIGISYQMHGLVIIDKGMEVIRLPIIWCDSRAVQIGEEMAKKIGHKKCLETMLNLPGNFTASKLKWIMDNEHKNYKKIHKIMLPGDYIAMKMTNEIKTTPSGLSEGIMWDFIDDDLAQIVLKAYGISQDLIPDRVPTFSVQGELTREAAAELGLKAGTKVSYRAGDQPNNALSLNVLHPGEIATTAGTSGVVYAVTDSKNYDPQSRVNIFVHVNHEKAKPRYGVLMCLNGCGILNSQLKNYFISEAGCGLNYEQMNTLAKKIHVGSDGIVILPYGNGAERTLGNKDINASVHGWNFNVHNKAHFYRAAQEGIVFALNYGLDIMRSMGVKIETVRAGKANMFLSDVFAEAFANTTGAVVELYNTDGSQGAARGAGIGAGIYAWGDAFVGLKPVGRFEPNEKLRQEYQAAYGIWKDVLEARLAQVKGK